MRSATSSEQVSSEAGGGRLGVAEAMSLLTGSEQRARSSLRPPRLQRGTALAVTGIGLGNVSYWLQEHVRFWGQSHLDKVSALVGMPLLVYALVVMVQGQSDASWGVASSERSRTSWIPVSVVLVGFPVAFVAMSPSVSPALRWCLVVVFVVALASTLELERRRMGGPVLRSLAALVLVSGWGILVVLRFDIWQLLLGGILLVYGGYQFVIARRDERRQGQRSLTSAAM